MNCQQWRGHIIETARGHAPAAEGHVRACPDCARFLHEQLALTAITARVASEAASTAPPPELEAVLLKTFVAVRKPRPRYTTRAILTGAIAATLLLAYYASSGSPPAPTPAPAVRAAPPPVSIAAAKPQPRPHKPRPKPPAPDTQPFVAIPYTVPLDPREPATVVRMEIPVAALAAAGLTIPAPDPAASAQTDVIISQDGRIRAVRLISISNRSTNQ
jgi:hypothetical protein